jgi:hypothetical protein
MSRLRPLREALNMLQEPPEHAADPPHLKQEEEARKSEEPLEPLEAVAQVLQGVKQRREHSFYLFY